MKLGIIIPYRNRAEHLAKSVPILKQYGHVYVIEQKDDKPFNRGKLINIGFLEYKNEFDYFCAHDVDMIPEFVNYAAPENPCHLATQAEQFGYKMPYPEYFGGVTLFPNNIFERVNGFSNHFWGYGAEDDHLRRKFIELSIPLQSRECRFFSLPHSRDINREERMRNVEKLKQPTEWSDGLSSCKYDVVYCEGDDHTDLLQVTL